MIAGPNGSGKSTLTKQLLAAGVDLGQYINADDIERDLPTEAGAARSKQAQDLAEAARRSCMAERESFTFETVMSHPSKIDLLGEARALGYSVVTYFVALEEPRLNVERVRQRVQLGGHPVPEDRIILRYQRCLDLLPAAIRECDRLVMFDNSYRRKALLPVVLVPFCDVRRVSRRAKKSVFRYFGSDGELLFPEAAGSLPRWSRAILTDSVLEANAQRALADSAKALRKALQNGPERRLPAFP